MLNFKVQTFEMANISNECTNRQKSVYDDHRD